MIKALSDVTFSLEQQPKSEAAHVVLLQLDYNNRFQEQYQRIKDLQSIVLMHNTDIENKIIHLFSISALMGCFSKAFFLDRNDAIIFRLEFGGTVLADAQMFLTWRG